MADRDKPFIEDLSTMDDLDVQNPVQIDSNLLIDARQLLFGPTISEGTFSIVYQGFYKSMAVAIKVLRPDSTNGKRSSSKTHAKFFMEVSMLSKINHDNIIKFIGATTEPSMMIITELMRGGTLQKFLWSLRPNCPDLKLSINYALEISQAMDYLHQNRIVHCDLKPTNLLLSEDQKKIKVADFDLAQEESGADMTPEAGTYRWMAPEMFSQESLLKGEKKYYDHKVDVYSFSIVLWEMLTNRTPFKSMSSIVVAYAVSKRQRPDIDDIPEQLVPLLQSCWAENPQDRPEFSQITVILEQFLHSLRASASNSPCQPSLFGTEPPLERKDESEEIPATDCLMDRPKEAEKKHLSFKLFCCCR